MLNKKGVSPLIATILLIAFAIALISVVINFGMSIVKGEGEKCIGDIRLGFLEINREKQVCFNSDTQKVNLRIKNDGSQPIEGMKLLLVGEGDSTTKDINIALNPVEEKKFAITYPSEIGAIEKIELVPKVKQDDYVVLCGEFSIEESPIREC